MKIIGGIFLAAVFLILSFRKADRIKQNTQTLKEIISFITDCKQNIRYEKMSRHQLLQLGKEKYRLIFANDKPEGFLTDFVDNLGKTDIIGQIALCDRYLHEAEKQLQTCETKNADLEKLYRILGFFGAAALVIMFI